ncbi:MAG: bacillithiol biosynthesis deacetylase BshB1 [Balneolaceae bacterium]|nr:bacillithiol biosynthesis deacetylase BshB1 [Balneolaceae bacterium]
MKLDVLVFAAHPDDAELNAGGTIASLVTEGKKVGIIDLTKGEMGTRGTVETRQIEVDNASKVLGIHYRSNLDLGDSILENNRENQTKIIEELRKLRPDLCLLGAPTDRHPDHGKATRLCMDALFYAGLAKFESSIDTQPWRPTTIVHYMQDRPFEPDFIVDISDHWETKKEAILAFSSQFNVSDPKLEPETYISNQAYFKQIEARARYFGHLAGFEFGEPFQKTNGPVGLQSLSFLR